MNQVWVGGGGQQKPDSLRFQAVCRCHDGSKLGRVNQVGQGGDLAQQEELRQEETVPFIKAW